MSALTKIFIVLQLICSLALAVLLVMMVSKQENSEKAKLAMQTENTALRATNAKDQSDSALKDAMLTKVTQESIQKQADADRQHTEDMKANGTLQTQLAQAEAEKLQANNSLAAAVNNNTTIANLNKSLADELSNDRPQLVKLEKENSELSRQVADGTNALAAAEQAIRRLQEQVVNNSDTGKSGTSTSPDGQAVLTMGKQTSVQINGKVSKVDEVAGRTLIELPLGTRDGVQMDTKFAIYRDNGYIGDAVVQRVTTDQSVAVVILTKPGQAVEAGDMATSGQ